MSTQSPAAPAQRGIGANVMNQLAVVNRPAPLSLLEHVAEILAASPAITDLLVRGSLAHGTADRLSDVDFVIGVTDTDFGDYIQALDALATSALGAILPGWADTIVADMGGLGYVYLVVQDGGLRQLDVYVAPSSTISGITEVTGAHPLLQRTPARPDSAREPTTWMQHPAIAAHRGRPRTCTDLLVETLVLGQMIRKRLTRGQELIAYHENHLLTSAVKNLIKTALAPTSRFHGWYRLEDVAVTPIGRACLNDLRALVTAPAVPTPESLNAALTRVLDVTERAAPETVDRLKTSIEAYWYYLDLA
jgi:predicted nucleotidyltransferase